MTQDINLVPDPWITGSLLSIPKPIRLSRNTESVARNHHDLSTVYSLAAALKSAGFVPIKLFRPGSRTSVLLVLRWKGFAPSPTNVLSHVVLAEVCQFRYSILSSKLFLREDLRFPTGASVLRLTSCGGKSTATSSAQAH